MNDQKPLSSFRKWSQLLPTPGNVIFTLIIAGLLIVRQQVWADNMLTSNTSGASATTINYQGRLTDASGNPRNGNFVMTFSLWDAAIGGTKIWGIESHLGVPVSNGLFNVGLGSLTAGGIPPTTWNGDRYLQITIDGETLTPRELIRSVPIAGMALTVPDGAIDTNHLIDGSVTQEKAPWLLAGTEVNTKIAHGQAIALQNTSIPQWGSVNIPLADYGFTETPTALCSTAGNAGAFWSCHVEYETAATFVIWVHHTLGDTNWSTVPVRWIAIGQ